MAAIKKELIAKNGVGAPHTSKRIEEAALELFYERGFKTTTMREIALACGLTPGALYNHFTSKDELLGRLMADIHVALEAAIADAVDAAGDDPHDQLKAYCYAHSLFHTRSIKEARVASREIDALRAPALAEVVASRRRSAALLRDILRRGVASGQFEVANEGVVANLILTMAVSIATWFRPDGEFTGEQVAELDAELAVRMVEEHGGAASDGPQNTGV